MLLTGEVSRKVNALNRGGLTGAEAAISLMTAQ